MSGLEVSVVYIQSYQVIFAITSKYLFVEKHLRTNTKVSLAKVSTN